MSYVITKQELDFMIEARKAFEENNKLVTYIDEFNEYIALRRELHPTEADIDVFKIDCFVGTFTNQLEKRNLHES